MGEIPTPESEISLASKKIMQGMARDIAMSDEAFDFFWESLMQRCNGDHEKLKRISEELIRAESGFKEEGKEIFRKIFLQNWFLLESRK